MEIQDVRRPTTVKPRTANLKQNLSQQAQAEFANLIKHVEVTGFHGTASVTVTVQDGRIQYARVTVDRRVQ